MSNSVASCLISLSRVPSTATKKEVKEALKLSDEEQLLIGCAAGGDSTLTSSAASLVRNNSIRWDRASDLAHWHHLTGMLFAFLRDNVPAGLAPEDVIQDLRSHYRFTGVRSILVRSEFRKAIRALQSHSIEVMALKGVTLIGSVYQDAGVREMSDIDLLVRVEEADRAQELVRDLGYEPVGSEEVQERTRQVHRHLPKLHNHERELSFEMHTHIVSSDSPLHFDIDAVWQHARPVELHGVEVLVPSPEHMLMHISVHFFLDRRFTSRSSLKQLHDIDGLIRNKDQAIDWNLFLDEVKKTGLDGPVFSVLSTTNTLMNSGVPVDVLDSLRPATYSKKLEELFIRQRVLPMNTLTATELVPHQSAYTFRAVLKALCRRIAPSRDYMHSHYSREGHDAPAGSARLARFGEFMQRLFGYLRSPLSFWQELRVDRWLHSLASEDTTPRNDESRSG